MGQRGDHGHVGARAAAQVVSRPRRAGVLTRSMPRGSITISRAPCAQAPLQPARRTPGGRRWGWRPSPPSRRPPAPTSKSWVPAEVPKVWLEAIAGGRVAHAGAGIHVVVAEGGADQLLHQVGFLVGAAAGGDAAHRLACRTAAWMRGIGRPRGRWPRPSCTSRQGSSMLSRIIGVGDAVRVGGVAPGEAALDAGVALVGLAVFPGRHAHHLCRPSSRP